jgi:multidrug efflux pump subunit AcrB
VVNDSIVLIDFINARVREGMPIGEALEESGARRFRPVMLTTITTIGGLIPILMETSIQAQILIPMATSIAFGELFATLIVLYIVPVTYSLYHSAGGHLDVQTVTAPPSQAVPAI